MGRGASLNEHGRPRGLGRALQIYNTACVLRLHMRRQPIVTEAQAARWRSAFGMVAEEAGREFLDLELPQVFVVAIKDAGSSDGVGQLPGASSPVQAGASGGGEGDDENPDQ